MSDETDNKTVSDQRRKLAMLQAQNNATFERIDKLGGSIDMLSVEAARNEAFFDWLYTNLLTEEQRITFAISWQEQLAEQLKKLEVAGREQAVAQRVAEAKAGQLRPAVPRGGRTASGIVIPG
jgi:PHD/YefM family antitoxin component YafN of YafNO toxin-antitoxin module